MGVGVCVWVCCVFGWVVPACVLVVVSGAGRLDGHLLAGSCMNGERHRDDEMKRFLRQWICVLPAGRGVWFRWGDLRSPPSAS